MGGWKVTVMLLPTFMVAIAKFALAIPSTASTSQPSMPGPMHWIAKDGAPASVQQFVASVPEQKSAYISLMQSNIKSLKSQINQMKDQRDTAAAQGKTVWRTYSNGESESSTFLPAEQANEMRSLTEGIEKTWKEVHADEAKIAAASDPLWLPDPNEGRESSTFGEEPLPANYKDYLVQAPVGTESAPAAQTDQPVANDPSCLQLAGPVWTSAGIAPVQTLRTGLKGTGLQLKVIGDGVRVTSVDATNVTLSSLRRSLGLGEMVIAPVAKFSLQNGTLNLEWVSRDGEPGAVKALQYALIQTMDSKGTPVESLRFTPRVENTLDYGRDGTTTLALPPAVTKGINLTAQDISTGWELASAPTTEPAATSAVTLKSDSVSLRISYDGAIDSVVLSRSDDLQQRYDMVRQQLTRALQAVQGSGSPYGNANNNSANNARIASLRTEMNSLQRQLYEDGQRWQSLSGSTVSLFLRNGLEVARFRLFNSEKGHPGFSPGPANRPPVTGNIFDDPPQSDRAAAPSPPVPTAGTIAAAPPPAKDGTVLNFDFSHQRSGFPGNVVLMASDQSVRGQIHHADWTTMAAAAGLHFGGGANQGRFDTTPDAEHSYVDLGSSVQGFPLKDFSIVATFVASNDGTIIGSGQDELWPREWGLSASAFWWTSVPGHASGAVGKVSNMINFSTKPNQLNHVCVTRWGNVVIAYVNGLRVLEQGTFPSDLSLPIYSNGLMIGNSKRNHGRYTQWNTFGGVISDVAIYPRVLSEAEVRKLFDAGSGSRASVGPTANEPLIALAQSLIESQAGSLAVKTTVGE